MRVFDIDTIVEHYLIAEVWAAVIYLDENTPVEADTIDAPIHDDTVAAARADVLGFLDADVREICERHNIDDEQIGHDFSLTRNHHGAGFWDRGHGHDGQILTEKCRPYGETNWWFDGTHLRTE